MVATTAATGRRSRAPAAERGRRLVRDRPEWWLLALAAVAWLVVLSWHAPSWGPLGSGGSGAGHTHHHTSPSGPAATGGAGASVAGASGAWAVMVVAMMLPVVALQGRWLALRSFRSRRAAVLGTFAVGYLAVWIALGSAAVVVLAPVRGRWWVVPVLLLVAAGFHVSDLRRRALERCGPLRAPRARGAGAVADCLRSGVRSGARCVVTCWALMVPMAVAHELWLMLAVAGVMAHERWPRPNPERRAIRVTGAAALVALALTAALDVSISG